MSQIEQVPQTISHMEHRYDFSTEKKIVDSMNPVRQGLRFECFVNMELNTKFPRHLPAREFHGDEYFEERFARTHAGDGGVDGINPIEKIAGQFKDMRIITGDTVAPFCVTAYKMRHTERYKDYEYIFAVPGYAKVQPRAHADLKTFNIKLMVFDEYQYRDEDKYTYSVITNNSTNENNMVTASTTPTDQTKKSNNFVPSKDLVKYQSDAVSFATQFCTDDSTSNAYYINGCCGCGKTSILRATIYDILTASIRDTSTTFVVISNSKQLHNQHLDTFGDFDNVKCYTIQKIALMFNLGNFSVLDLMSSYANRYIVLDEAHHYFGKMTWQVAIATLSGNQSAKEYFSTRTIANMLSDMISSVESLVSHDEVNHMNDDFSECDTDTDDNSEDTVNQVSGKVPRFVSDAPTKDQLMLKCKTIYMSATLPPTIKPDINIPYEVAQTAGRVTDYRVSLVQLPRLSNTNNSRVVAVCDTLCNISHENKIDMKSTLIFWSTTKRAREATKFFNKHGFASISVTRKSPQSVVDAFTGDNANEVFQQYAFVNVYKMLNEGANIPCICTIVFGDDRASIVNGLQSAFRGNRMFIGKLFTNLIVFSGENNEINTSAVLYMANQTREVTTLMNNDDISNDQVVVAVKKTGRFIPISCASIARRPGSVFNDETSDDANVFVEQAYKIVFSTMISEMRKAGITKSDVIYLSRIEYLKRTFPENIKFEMSKQNIRVENHTYEWQGTTIPDETFNIKKFVNTLRLTVNGVHMTNKFSDVVIESASTWVHLYRRTTLDDLYDKYKDSDGPPTYSSDIRLANAWRHCSIGKNFVRSNHPIRKLKWKDVDWDVIDENFRTHPHRDKHTTKTVKRKTEKHDVKTIKKARHE
ncbi:hypothetical protein [Emiliania huxleyi virus 99B1]|nr:hypothetical protein [Emiliania huxleyi virus 99B1]|mmetsp:Transcript_8097/g.24055  ORF Transcript_8097/g.24055 Transcript_8097/m.24055 type:complete len:871 (-) Transcript_8097:90-2702(-)